MFYKSLPYFYPLVTTTATIVKSNAPKNTFILKDQSNMNNNYFHINKKNDIHNIDIINLNIKENNVFKIIKYFIIFTIFFKNECIYNKNNKQLNIEFTNICLKNSPILLKTLIFAKSKLYIKLMYKFNQASLYLMNFLLTNSIVLNKNYNKYVLQYIDININITKLTFLFIPYLLSILNLQLFYNIGYLFFI